MASLSKLLLLLLLLCAVVLVAMADPDPAAGRRRGRSRDGGGGGGDDVQGKIRMVQRVAKGTQKALEEEAAAALDGGDEDGSKDASRDGRLFSLFNIVQFTNAACTSTSSGTSTNRNGTCYTANECSSKSGTSAGSCAAGFGVCCVFLVDTSGSTVNQNCTYVRNPSYPSAYTDTTAVSYTVNKVSNNICRLRLDFESFTIQGTGNTEELDITAGTAGGACLDTFDVTVNTGQRIPQICGKNTGQHMYIDIGLASSDTASLDFTFDGSSTDRTWEIKVSQIPCSGQCVNDYLPPEGCLQYHQGITGRITTFNFLDSTDNHLKEQDYSICIRQEDNYCCIQYTVCEDDNSFSLSTIGSAGATSSADSLCTLDFVGISSSSSSCDYDSGTLSVANKYCGPYLNFAMEQSVDMSVCDCTAPFVVDIFTDALADDVTTTTTPNTVLSRGLCLTYVQVPCN